MKSYIPLAIMFSFFCCSKDDPNPVSIDDSPVHLAGVILSGASHQVASYWKNGVYNALTNDTTNSGVSSLCIDNSSVLIGGSISGGVFYTGRGVIWQNGKETIIEGAYGNTTLLASHNNNVVGVWKDDSLGWVLSKNGIAQPILDTAYSLPIAMALLGDDVFIAGNAYGNVHPQPFYEDHFAQCWKNEKLIFRESVRSHVTSIFTHGNDIYMAGYLTAPYPGVDIACYWKNGERFNLTDGSFESVAKSIFVTDTHVYVSGEVNFEAFYWKDGVATQLWYGQSGANSIFVKGTDVHVAGYSDGGPAYWKNNIRQKISNQDKQGWINFIAVDSN